MSHRPGGVIPWRRFPLSIKMKLFNGRKHLSRLTYSGHECTCSNEDRFKYVLLKSLALVFEKAKVKTYFHVSDTFDKDPQLLDIRKKLWFPHGFASEGELKGKQ